MKYVAQMIVGVAFMAVLAMGLRHVAEIVRGAITGEGIRGLVLWHSDWDEALALAAQQNKRVLVEFARESSPRCHELAKKGWTRMDIATAATDYVPVMVDIDKHPELAKQFEIATVPSLAVIDAKSQSIVRDGRDETFSPDELLVWLKPDAKPTKWEFASPGDGGVGEQKNLFDGQKDSFGQ